MFLLIACTEPSPSDSAPKDTVEVDGDGDGYLADDCDDADPAVHPGADETCDDRDEDCDGAVDEGALDAATWFVDADGDGFGAGSGEVACVAPTGTTETDGDCDDADAAVHPGAPELCDGLDNDCDEATGEAGVLLDGVPGHTSVQSAIDAAPEGATVELCGGEWRESLTVARDLRLVGGGATIRAAGGPALRITAGDIVVEDLTLTGGTGVEVDGVTRGGGVYMDAGQLSLVDSTVSGNEAEWGGGIYGASLHLSNVEVAENEATDGGGVFVPDAGVLVVEAGRFGNNAAENVGGALYLGIGAVADTSDTTWDGNRSELYAGAVYADEASVLTDVASLFDNDASTDKGGAFYLRYASFVGSGTRFVGCSGSWGGAAMLYGSTMELDAGEVTYNMAELGGAFYVYAESDLRISGGIVQGNVATAGGGARVRTTSSLASVGADWGSGTTDNTPDDVDMDDGSYTFGTEDFACDSDSGVCQ